MPFSIIVIIDKNNGIGKNSAMPWHFPLDLKHFAKITTITQSSKKINAVIMGRKTWESIPESHRPLKNRLNAVLTHDNNMRFPENIFKFSSLDDALCSLYDNPKIENVFVIGGGKVFAEAINHTQCQKLYVTQIDKTFDCDTFFPRIDLEKFKLIDKSPTVIDKDVELNFLLYEKI